MTKRKIPITCIGGANVDRKAKIIHNVRLHSSNSVTSTTSCGGVSRNIAEYLGRLGCNTYLLTCIGRDREGDWISEMTEAYVKLDGTYVHPTEKTGSYTAILDKLGDMVIGIADMGIYDTITPLFIEERWPYISSSRLVVMDTNFPEEVISYIIERCEQEKIPLCVVPVSGEKVSRLPISLEGISLLILNQEEAQILSGSSIISLTDLMKSANRLIEKGVDKVIITCGARGLIYKTSSGKEGYITPPRINIVDVTGAGDAFASGLLYSYMIKGIELEKACKYGLSCSILALQTQETVYSRLNKDLLAKTYELYFEQEPIR